MAKKSTKAELSTGELYERKLVDWLNQGMTKGGLKRVALARALGIGPSEASKLCTPPDSPQGVHRKILASQLFTISDFIDETIPVPDGWAPLSKLGTVPIIGEAGADEWSKEEAQADGQTLPLPPKHRFSSLPHFATKMVSDSVSRLIPKGAFAVYVPYFEARPALTDGDLILVRHTIPKYSLRRSLILQVHSTAEGFELHSASYTPDSAVKPLILSEDGKNIANTEEIIETVGLVVWKCGPVSFS